MRWRLGPSGAESGAVERRMVEVVCEKGWWLLPATTRGGSNVPEKRCCCGAGAAAAGCESERKADATAGLDSKFTPYKGMSTT